MWWRLLVVAVLIAGAVVGWEYGGVDDAVAAQRAVRDSGWRYVGDTTLSNDQYYALVDDLSKRDSSLQTRNDLVIRVVNLDGSVDVEYSFFSVEDYAYLGLNRQEPTDEVVYALGFSLSTDILPMLLAVTLVMFCVGFLNPRSSN